MTKSLPCLILPLEESNLILPSAALAGIISYEKPEFLKEAPVWFLGLLTWRGMHIPLVNVELMETHLAWQKKQSGEAVINQKAHIVILNRTYKVQAQQYPFFSIVVKKIPKWLGLTTEDITLKEEVSAKNPRFIMEVQIQKERAYIPNLSYLWKLIDELPSRLQWFQQLSI